MASFWDRIKPAEVDPVVVDVSVRDGGHVLELVWEDGQRSTATAQAMRQNCPCAACVDEWTNQRTLDPAKVPADLAFAQVGKIGNYALSLSFSDGHSSGIFPWKHLRGVTR